MPAGAGPPLVGVSSWRKELLLTAIEKIACGGQRALQIDDRPFQAGVQEPNPSTHRDNSGGKVRRVEQPCFHVESVDLVLLFRADLS